MNNNTYCFICENPQVDQPFHGLAKSPVCTGCREIILSAKKEIPRYLKGSKHNQPGYTVKLRRDYASLHTTAVANNHVPMQPANLNIAFEFSNGGNWMCVDIKDEQGADLRYLHQPQLVD